VLLAFLAFQGLRPSAPRRVVVLKVGAMPSVPSFEFEQFAGHGLLQSGRPGRMPSANCNTVRRLLTENGLFIVPRSAAWDRRLISSA